jgi:hypothetical protein
MEARYRLLERQRATKAQKERHGLLVETQLARWEDEKKGGVCGGSKVRRDEV